MRKIIDFCKKKYKLLIPIMAVIVLVGALIFFYNEYKYDNYRNKKDVNVYQYFGGVKTDYTLTLTYNLKDLIVDAKAKDAKIEYDATPIYYLEEEKVLFPHEMTMVFPLREGSQYKLYKYSTYYLKDNVRYINNNNNEDNDYNNFFLYDGSNIFFFPYDVTLKVNKKEIPLGKNSTVTLVGDTLIYYDYGKGASDIIELNGKDATINSENINVNLRQKYVLSFEKEVLLFSPDNLKPVSK
mgnify:CR=1 FL=1